MGTGHLPRPAGSTTPLLHSPPSCILHWLKLNLLPTSPTGLFRTGWSQTLPLQELFPCHRSLRVARAGTQPLRYLTARRRFTRALPTTPKNSAPAARGQSGAAFPVLGASRPPRANPAPPRSATMLRLNRASGGIPAGPAPIHCRRWRQPPTRAFVNRGPRAAGPGVSSRAPSKPRRRRA